jgi:hypothetical protein
MSDGDAVHDGFCTEVLIQVCAAELNGDWVRVHDVDAEFALVACDAWFRKARYLSELEDGCRLSENVCCCGPSRAEHDPGGAAGEPRD